MAATKSQRIGIWIIATFMAIGTVGSFAIIVLANSNDQRDKSTVQELTAKYQADVAARDKALSEKYFPIFSQYASRSVPFSADDVSELSHEDLKIGDGDALTTESSFHAYYIGWMPDGTVFDGSIASDQEALKAPFQVNPGEVITGWTEGVVGMNVGGVRELTIPSDLAYGENGSSSIPGNTPLRFVIFVIPTPDEVEIPQELINYYQKGRLQ